MGFIFYVFKLQTIKHSPVECVAILGQRRERERGSLYGCAKRWWVGGSRHKKLRERFFFTNSIVNRVSFLMVGRLVGVFPSSLGEV